MERRKDILKITQLVLAVLIVFVMVCGMALLFISGGSNPGSEKNGVNTEELKATLPGTEETKVKDKIVISRSGASKEERDEEESKELTDDYIIPASNSKLLTSSDIAGLSAKELNYAKNEIYARHGRKFASSELQTYFNSKSWYDGRYEPTDFDQNYSISVLSDVEKKNAEFLKEAVSAAGGYELDQ